MHDDPKSEWIHLWTKKPMAPHPGYLAVADAFVGGLDSLIDGGFLRELVAIYREGSCSVYGRRGPVRNLEQQVVEMVRKNPRSIRDFRRVFLRRSRALLRFCFSIPDEPSTLSNQDLCAWYNEYEQNYRNTYVFGEPVAWLISESLSGYLLEYIDREGIVCDDLGPAGILEVLTTDDRLPPASVEELEFLSLAEQVQRRAVERDGVPGIFQQSLEEDVEIQELVRTHLRKWRWIPCDFDATPWDEEYLIHRLVDILRRPAGVIHAKKSSLRRFSREVRARQKQIIRRNRIDRYHLSLFEALRHASFLFARRKEEFAKAHLLLAPLLSEVFHRCGMEYATGCYLLADEVRDALLRDRLPDPEDIHSRRTMSVLHSTAPGAHRFVDATERDRVLEEIRELDERSLSRES
jgi:hypothetical protein